MRREGTGIGYVAVYDFDVEAASNEIEIQRFPSADIGMASVRRSEPERAPDGGTCGYPCRPCGG